MSTRRHIIQALPFGAWLALSGCSDKASPTPAVAPQPAAAPAPAPTEATAPTPASAPAPATTAAAPGPMVDPAEPTAAGLGYVSNGADTKNPQRLPGAACGNCALFGGKAGDTAGPCPLFAGKQVAATGWCTAYAKKA